MIAVYFLIMKTLLLYGLLTRGRRLLSFVITLITFHISREKPILFSGEASFTFFKR